MFYVYLFSALNSGKSDEWDLLLCWSGLLNKLSFLFLSLFPDSLELRLGGPPEIGDEELEDWDYETGFFFG